jgi:hypothetical protein
VTGAVTEVTAPTAPEPRVRKERPAAQLLLAYRAAGLLGALGVLLYMMWPDFFSGFAVIDDHSVIDMMGRHSRLPITEAPGWLASKTAEPLGRFRPVYWLGQVTESATAGHHPSLWYFDRFALAAIALTAVYVTAVRFTGTIGAAVLSLTPFAGLQFETWTRLGPNEDYAFPLAVAGLALLVHLVLAGKPPAKLWPGYALLLASALAKENFFLVLVVAVPATLLQYGLRRLRRPDVVVIGVIAAAAALDLLGILIKTGEYGAVYPQSHTWATFKTYGHYFLGSADRSQAFGTGAIVALVLLGVYARTRQRVITAGALVALVALLIVPQLAFYAGNSQTGRYLYPMVLGPTVVWGICLWQARLLAWWPARLFISAVLVTAMAWPLHVVVPLNRESAGQTAKSNKTFERGLATLEATIDRDHADVVVLQPYDALNDFEQVLSLARYLADAGGYRVMIASPFTRSPGFDTVLAEQIDLWARNGSHNILPFKPTKNCISFLFAPMPAVCGHTA